LVVGGIVGIVVCFSLAERPAAAVVIVSTALGAILAQALRRAVGPHS
jgi:hypothetical protein